MAISESWAYLLDPGLRAIFEQQAQALSASAKAPLLFNVQSSNKAVEYDLSVGGFQDVPEYEGAIEFDEPSQNYRSSYTHKEYALGFKVERKLVDDDLYNIINGRPAGLAISATRTRETHAASVFNNAFSSSYTGGDAVCLCSDSHPHGPDNSGSTQDNAGSTALSYTSIDSTRQLMRAFTDDRGKLMPINPDTILVPPELEETAVNLWLAAGKPGTADNDFNFVNRVMRRVIVWDQLTDANNWFMIDSAMAKRFLNWFDRVPMEIAMDPTSDFDLEARWRLYMRYSYGWSDWRWVYGHTV